jgi:tetratricopeptide (TPR) repeat protein
MASKANKEKAQKLVDEASELLKRIDAEPENKIQLALQVLELMNEAIALDETNDNAWSNRGFAKYSLKQYEEAIKDYDEALRLNPDDKLFQNNRLAADVAYKRGKRAKNVIEKRDDIIITLEKKTKMPEAALYIVKHCSGDFTSNPFCYYSFVFLTNFWLY